MNVKKIRLLNQQLAAPRFADVRDLVEWFGMMQAQDYQMMQWAVAMRLKHPSVSALADFFLPEYEEDVTKALERYHVVMSDAIHQKSLGK